MPESQQFAPTKHDTTGIYRYKSNGGLEVERQSVGMGSPEEALNALSIATSDLDGRTQNEAETRHKIIDIVLHDLLSWPRNRVFVEESIRPGFADYVLRKSDASDLLFIEAKKAGIFFTLPRPGKKEDRSGYISVQTLMSDLPTKDAMMQVRAY